MVIKDYKKGDEGAILELFRLAFKKEMDLSYWRWRFQLNPAGNHLIKLMWIDNLLVGHYAVSPIRMNIFGKSEMAALSGTTMTHPNHNGRGVLKKLALNLYEDIEVQKGFKAVCGFPNKNSHYSLVKNLGWTDVGVVHTLTMPIGNWDSNLSTSVIESKNFSKKHELRLNGLSSGFCLNVIKDVPYLDWRYSSNPSQDYTVFNYDDGGQEGFIVAKIYPSNIHQEYYDLYIMELGLTKDQLDLLKILIGHMIAYYNVRFEGVKLWLNLWDERHIVLEKMGFTLEEGRLTFFGIRNNTGNEQAEILRNWSYSFGDSDVY